MSRNQNRKGGDKRGRADEWMTDVRDPAALQNAAFEAYYKDNVVPAAEWEAFMACLQTGLPMSIRFNRAAPHVDAVDAFVSERLADVFESKRIPFFPDQRALQCGVSRGDLKRREANRTLKKIVAAMNEGGYLTRQETVSMLPPLLLQVEPGMRVLDMCAAPGSKTSQILEYLLCGNVTGGVVVANDVNASRLDVLHHQTSRAAGAHLHVIITNTDATRFPLLPAAARFDRVLCDVMCSGDGTLRKSIDMWPRWGPLQGANLHHSQTRVLLRGMASCKTGGIVVYSTCSLNPIEDEAVVSACLAQTKGTFELIDPTPLLPGLCASPGMTAWSVTTRDLTTVLRTYEEAKVYMESQSDRRAFQYAPTMFADTALLVGQHMERTRRILPHAQDTGGFFVAALRCVAAVPDDARAPEATATAEPPMRPLSESMRATVQRALSLPDTFPFDQLVLRNEECRDQKIYLANADAIALSQQLGGRVVHVGAKVFESVVKYSNDKLRFCADAVADLVSFLPPSFVVPVSPSLLLELAAEATMTYSDFSAKSGRAVVDLPPSFVLTTTWSVGGPIYVAAEKSTKLGKLVAHVAGWQATVCKLALQLPLVDAAGEEGDEAAKDAATAAGHDE
ncbi:NOL1/NOP2/sun family/FtsJ-like methyltransferase [Novymonas esmeraldas]|uniref:NOL1/NOP2/sun family/FtsJ-like methyltransferase n=1 Tax=Novymonas esmeraldas TaxID=1808958 RepID=A0AAW0F4Z6_9TRYP